MNVRITYGFRLLSAEVRPALNKNKNNNNKDKDSCVAPPSVQIIIPSFYPQKQVLFRSSPRK